MSTPTVNVPAATVYVVDPKNAHVGWAHPLPNGWLALVPQNHYLLVKTELQIQQQQVATLEKIVIRNAKRLLKKEKEIQRLKEIVSEVHGWIVCAGITTPEDMAGNFERIAEITTPKDDEL